jgi:hypothetical protein
MGGPAGPQGLQGQFPIAAAVVNRQGHTCGQQVGGHGCSKGAETQKSHPGPARIGNSHGPKIALVTTLPRAAMADDGAWLVSP